MNTTATTMVVDGVSVEAPDDPRALPDIRPTHVVCPARINPDHSRHVIPGRLYPITSLGDKWDNGFHADLSGNDTSGLLRNVYLLWTHCAFLRYYREISDVWIPVIILADGRIQRVRCPYVG